MRLCQPVGDQPNLAVLVNVAHRHMCKTRIDTQCGRQPGGEQRMATKIRKEIGTAPDRLAGKQLGQRCEQHFFRWRPRRVGAPIARRRQHQRTRFQSLAINLPRVQPRHFRQNLKVTRHHVRWQRCAERATQHGRRQHLTTVRDDEGDQLIDAILLAQHHSDCADATLPGQHGFDLSELDPEAANFHLVVGAAQALHAAV